MGRETQEAFEALKNALSADTVLAYFDPAADHEVHVDGCPLGVSATLVQRSPNEDTGNTDVFLYGKPFIVVTDRKSLEVIFKNQREMTGNYRN